MAAGSRGRLAAPSPMLRPKENSLSASLASSTKEGHDSSPHRGLEGADSVSILQPLSLFNHRQYLQRVWSHPSSQMTTSSKSQNPFHPRGGSSCSRTETTINLMLCGKVPLCSWSSSKLLSLPDLIYKYALQRKPWNSHSSLSQSSTGGAVFVCVCSQVTRERNRITGRGSTKKKSQKQL